MKVPRYIIAFLRGFAQYLAVLVTVIGIMFLFVYLFLLAMARAFG